MGISSKKSRRARATFARCAALTTTMTTLTSSTGNAPTRAPYTAKNSAPARLSTRSRTTALIISETTTSADPA